MAADDSADRRPPTSAIVTGYKSASLQVAVLLSYFMLNDMPSFAALTVVAPGERLSFLAIFETPCFSFAIDFNMRRSSLVHARRTAFFLAILPPLIRSGRIAYDSFKYDRKFLIVA